MKTIIVLISALFCVSHLSAQAYLYDVTKTFQEFRYAYQCDVDFSKQVMLYNKENKLTYEKWVFKDTGKEPPIPYYVRVIEEDTWTKKRCYSIVNDAFPPGAKLSTRGYELGICMYIDSNTGKVIEVDFTLSTTNSFATYPVSVYREIELELKKNIWFTTTASGKKMNYLVQWWRQSIGETILD